MVGSARVKWNKKRGFGMGTLGCKGTWEKKVGEGCDNFNLTLRNPPPNFSPDRRSFRSSICQCSLRLMTLRLALAASAFRKNLQFVTN